MSDVLPELMEALEEADVIPRGSDATYYRGILRGLAGLEEKGWRFKPPPATLGTGDHGANRPEPLHTGQQ